MKKKRSNAGTSIWKRGAELLWPLAFIVAIGFLVIVSTKWFQERGPVPEVPKVVWVALAALALIVGAHFVHCFTRNLPETAKVLRRELRAIFIYAYVFQALAIVLPLAPFVVAMEPQCSNRWAGVVYGCVDGESGPGSELTRCTEGSADGQWLLHIGSRSLDGNSGDHVRLSRGLVVPLYVVVLAIIGGAVGMTRRLPEIQRRASYSYRCEKCRLTSIKAREQVVFQIMQILTAPLIAIMAFSAFEPHTIALAVTVGFASGFASEAILVKIRQASDAVVRGVREK